MARVEAVWDEEAQVFFSRSDISGLHVEAGTLEEFGPNMAVGLRLLGVKGRIDVALASAEFEVKWPE